MLTEINPINEMSSPTSKQQIYIHESNFFQPHKVGVKAIAQESTHSYYAIAKNHNNTNDIGQPLTLIDIFFSPRGLIPKYMSTIIVYEELTGIAWIGQKYLLSVSRQATINIHEIKSGEKVKTMTTDYGPILSMGFSYDRKLLVTGTEYGYVATYRIADCGTTVEFVSKMTKIADPITALGFHITQKETIPAQKKSKPFKVVTAGKRKRSESSDDESDDDDVDDQSTEYLSSFDVTIYGASKQNVIAWDFHKKTILDTMMIGNDVTSILALQRGDLVVGDDKGYLSIYDEKSFTNRQTIKVLDKGILCVAKSENERTILVGGKEPTIALLKMEKIRENCGEYGLFERLKGHKGYITCGVFRSRREFYTGSDDGTLIKFVKRHKVLERYDLEPVSNNCIKFAGNGQVLVNYGKSLTVYKVAELGDNRSSFTENRVTNQFLEVPEKLCTLRIRSFVHSATFDDKWICYSTRKNVSIHRRSDLQRAEFVYQKIPNCQLMQLCCDGQYLILGQQRTVHLIRLIQNYDDLLMMKNPGHDIVFSCETRGYVRNAQYNKSLNMLIVSCAIPESHLVTFGLPGGAGKKKKVGFLSKLQLPTTISHMAQNCSDPNDTRIYIYTFTNQLVIADLATKNWEQDLIEQMKNKDQVTGLTNNSYILGLLVKDKKECIMYDKCNIYKVDLSTNQIVSAVTRYENITIMDKTSFSMSDELLIVSSLA